ncbi:hypothetical protein ACQJBY_036089 [Aegilops geniculata]
MRGGRSGGGGLRNPCLTMHQPWASLLVHGIKRVEGRSWPSPVTGRLWIHAASKVPDPDTVAAMEDFYREIYAVDGVHHIDFPQHYPVSRLLGPYPSSSLLATAAAAAPLSLLTPLPIDYCSGCVEVVGCVRSEELVCWEDVPQSVRLEGLTDFCWLCENPQKLVVPFEMRGYQGVYNLERRVYEGASRGLSPVQGPLPVKFPLPDPRNPLSLKPGSLNFGSSKSALVKTESVSAAIAGARAAATQYSRKGSTAATSSEIQTRGKSRENHADGSSGSGALASAVQNSPSHPQNQDPSPVVQNSSSHSVNQNPSPVVQNSPSYSQTRDPQYIAQSSLSYAQTRNPQYMVQSSPSYSQTQNPQYMVQSSPSYSQNQSQSSNIQSTPFYFHDQNPSSNVQNSPFHLHNNQNQSSNVHNSPSHFHYQNQSSTVHNSPSYSHNQNPSPNVQNGPSYSQNHNPSPVAQNSPSFLQHQNAEPRRSPRLQGGAPHRRR